MAPAAIENDLVGRVSNVEMAAPMTLHIGVAEVPLCNIPTLGSVICVIHFEINGLY